MQIEEICRRHSDYDKKIFDIEFDNLRKVKCIPIIENKLSEKYTGNKNDGNSWILYWLGLTTQKPIDEFSLVINTSARVSIPDCDLDFEDDRRSEIFEYIINKYGEDFVAQVVTFSHMKARAAIRDVGRALDKPTYQMDLLAKSILGTPGKPITIENSLDSHSPYFSKSFSDKYNNENGTKEIVDLAKDLENVTRQVGMHAAAILIGDKPLKEYIPLMNGKNSKTRWMSQLDYPTAESMGLLKVDVLGLITLRIIRECCSLINQKTEKNITYESIPFLDDSAFEVLRNGNTTGVFQLENSGMRRYLVQMQPKTFNDVAAMISLYRPGPLQYIPLYIDRMHGKIGKNIKHSLLEEIVSDTQGILIFQEQVNSVFMNLAGYDSGKADKMRKNISKKNVDEINKGRGDFIKGCSSNNIESDIANSIYDDINEFALYGFNRCVSGSTKIMRSKKDKGIECYTVEELYNIKNSSDYAERFLCNELHIEFNKHGYGFGFSMNIDRKVKKNKIIDIRHAGFRQLYRVTTSLGHYIICTDNHKFPTPYGEKILSNIMIGDELFVIDKRRKSKIIETDTIVSIEDWGISEVYDVEMDAPNHNFIVDNGLVTSNSHAASYARLSLITAWLKGNYPREYITACLLCEGEDNNKRTKYIEDARLNGINVLPPRIGGSKTFSIENERIIFGLGSINGIGTDIAQKISKCESIEDLLELKLKSNQIASLVYAGCLDHYHTDRKEIIGNIDVFSEYITYLSKYVRTGQNLLIKPKFKTINAASTHYDTAMKEYESLGAWLQFHPLDMLSKETLESINHSDEINDLEYGNFILVITSLEPIVTKKGAQMYKFIGIDKYGSIECIVSVQATKTITLENGNIVHCSGAINNNDGTSASVFVNQIKVIRIRENEE